jgi:peptide/nickel transport system permease protein
MLQLIIRRIFIMIPVLFLVSLMVFSLILLVPGDPAVTLAGENATEEQIEATRERLGLNDPVIEQYGRWVGNAIRGDLGSSLFSSQKVTDAIVQRIPATLSLAGGAIVLSVLLGVPAGIVAAIYRGRWPDRLVGLGAASALAMPNYFVAMLLILFFAIWNPWFPATSFVPFSEGPGEWAKHLVLPWITLSLSPAAVITRQLRSSLIGVLGQDYVRTARAKGLRGRTVILKHSLKNAAIPVVTVLGTQIAFALGGSVIVEQVFGIAGVGQLAITSVQKRDLPLIQGIVVMATLLVLFCNLLVDLAYGFLNPKVRVR